MKEPKCLRFHFFPYCIKEQSKLNYKIRNIESINKFKVEISNFIRSKANSVFNIHDTNRIKLLSGLGLNGITLMTQQIPYAHVVFSTLFLNNVCILNPALKNQSNEKFLNVFLYVSKHFNWKMQKEILKATIKILKRSERFNGPLF